MSLKHKFKSFVKNQFGLLLERDNPANVGQTQIAYLLKKYEINNVIDIGANVGQYGNFILGTGFTGKIYSFEPIKSCYNQLEKLSMSVQNWFTYHTAIGDINGESLINISKNFESSSILSTIDHLPMYEDLITAPTNEKISICTLDYFLKNQKLEGRTYLKIDTQGFEMQVLQGAVESIGTMTCIEIETSLSSVYKNGSRIEEVISFLKPYGFIPYNIAKGMQNPTTGQLFEVDIYFVKADLLSK